MRTADLAARQRTAQREPPERRRFERLRRGLRPETVLIGLVVALVAYLALVPLLFMAGHALLDEGRPTIAAFRRAYGANELGSMFTNSFWFAAGSTALALIIGTALAYLLERTDLPLRTVVLAGALVPLVIPGVLYTISWIFLAAPRSGVINVALEPVFGRPVVDVFGMGGMILVQGLHLTPLALLIMIAAFRSLDPALEESARMSAVRPSTIFRRITLPLLRPALSLAALLLALRSLEAFEVPALLGLPEQRWVFTSRIWRALDSFPAQYDQAGAYALTLVALTAIGVLMHARLSRGHRRFETITGRGLRPQAVALGRWRWVVMSGIGLYLVVAVLLPLLALVYVSTLRFYAPISLDRLSEASLASYGEVLRDAASRRAALNSLVLAVTAATVVVLVTAVIAWLVVRTRTRGRWLIGGVAFAPLVIPGLVLGTALLFVYLRVPLPVYGTIWILLIAYVTRYLPYGMAAGTAAMHQISRELEETAHASGVSWLKTFRHVLLPLLAPGLIAGWVYIVSVASRELSSSILLYSPGNEVLSVRLWEHYENGEFPELAALGVLMVLALAPLAALAYRFGSRVSIRGT